MIENYTKKPNKFVGFLLTFYIMGSSFIQYFKLFNIPLYYYLLISLFMYSILKKYNKDSKLVLFLSFWFMYALFLTVIKFNSYTYKIFVLLSVNLVGVYVVVQLCLYNWNYIRYCISGIRLGLICNVIVGIWEVSTNMHVKVLSLDYERRFSGIPVTFYPNANDLSTVLVCMSVILLLGIIYSRSKINKILDSVIIMVTYFIIIKTRSSIGIISLPAILLIALLVKIPVKIKTLLYPIIISVITLSYNFIFTIFENNYYESIKGRLPLWKSSINLLISSLGLGVGPGQNVVIGNGNVHFIFLEVISEYGLIIGIGFIFFYFADIKRCYKDCSGMLRSSIISFMIFFILLSTSSSSMTKLPIVWISVAMLHIFIRINSFNNCNREQLIKVK